MNIIRREPFAETEDFIRSFFPPQISRWLRLGADNGSTGTEWAPVADTSETEKEYLVKAELPGVRREDVHVTLEDGVLTIRGERKQEKEHKDEKMHRIERFHGSFMRSFMLPDNADPTSVRAECKDGVLTVHVPKKVPSTPAGPIEIKIQ
ncbi:MAG: Hsp20/alpha crystallin family protein [Pseudomonadota bacterium]|jgi:HSP20 family protein|nr:MAG: heat-shock protein [Pseudomonadota bacterium]